MVNVKRYVARTAREALAALKAELGPDAVVLSNRQVPEGVEIVAMPPEQMSALNATVRQARAPAAPPPAPQAAPQMAAPMASQAASRLASQVSQRPAPTASVSPQAAPQTRRVAPPARAVPETDSDDFTVTLGQHIARLAREQAPALAPRAQAQSLLDDTQRAAQPPVIRAFNPPHVNEFGEEIAHPTLRGHAPRDAEPRRELQGDPYGDAYGDEYQDYRADVHRDAREESPYRARRSSQAPREERAPARVAPAAEAPAQSEQAAPERDPQVAALEATNARLMDELGSIKGLLERQLAGFAWGEISRNSPARTQMMSDLLEAGFSAELTRRLTEDLADELTQTELRNQVKARINRFLPLLESDADIIDRGGVYALVGPTGVGKTTTTAKLAARCVVRHGADKLALITTDGYRIGAHEQLRIYGRILGVPVHVVRDAADLRRTLQDLRNKHMVLIDTIGMSQRDKMVVEQASMLTAAGCVRRLLVLNATARGDTLDDVLRAYEGPDLAGCILSKVDEAASLAPVVDVAIRHELQVFYVANGQRVPEDLHLPNRNYLVHRAMKEIAADSPWKLGSEEACLVMASRSGQSQAKRRGAAL